MEEMLIGTYIRQKRQDRGWTQEYLCDGICSVPTLSRIETNNRAPSNSVLKTLLERLGLPAGQFIALVSPTVIDFEQLQKDIRHDEIRFRRASQSERDTLRPQIMEKLTKLKELVGDGNQFVQQFILSTKVSIDTREGLYSPEERLDTLIEAIRLTIPNFKVSKIPDYPYSVMEVIIINQIARSYAQMGNRKKAIFISRKLLQYIEKNNKGLDKYPRQFCLVAHNCAIDLVLEKDFQKAVALSKKGQRVSVEEGDYQFLPGFLAIQAECYFFLGNLDKSKHLYHQAYYLYEVLGDVANRMIIEQEMKERLCIRPTY